MLYIYIYNLVGYVLKYFSDLHVAGLFFNHNFIPADEIHLKIGGDHGGGTF